MNKIKLGHHLVPHNQMQNISRPFHKFRSFINTPIELATGKGLMSKYKFHRDVYEMENELEYDIEKRNNYTAWAQNGSKLACQRKNTN